MINITSHTSFNSLQAIQHWRSVFSLKFIELTLDQVLLGFCPRNADRIALSHPKYIHDSNNIHSLMSIQSGCLGNANSL